MLEELLQRLLGGGAPINRLSAAGQDNSAGYSYGPGGQYTGGSPLQAAPQAAAAPQQAPMGQPAPQPAPQGNSGGLLSNLFGRKPQAGNATVGYLMRNGLDEGTAILTAGNPELLQDFLKQRMKGQEPQKPLEINGKLVDPNDYHVLADFSTPDKGPQPTSDMQEYQYAVQSGAFKGTFTDWQTKGVRDQDVGFSREQGLRKEYSGGLEYKRYDDVRASYERVRASAQRDSGAGDLGLIFGFMKLLDPGSVVREGEFANAENTAGVPDRIRNLYNRIVSGDRLNQDQRQEFVSTAGDLYQQEANRLAGVNKRFSSIAESYQIDPGRVVVQPQEYDPLNLMPAAPAAEAEPATPQGADGPPEGWTGDKSLWQYMTPEERALWK